VLGSGSDIEDRRGDDRPRLLEQHGAGAVVPKNGEASANQDPRMVGVGRQRRAAP
jgi:hypothetical protein